MLGIATFTNSAQAACDADTLGVSRTITIDTTGGKLYGGLQYDVSKLLKDREVILTFDDGPLRRHTRKVLKALKSHCTKATFFMVGRMAVSDPAMVREVEQSGHTIANHTWSHKNLFRRSARSAGGEIELGISAVRIAAGKPISPFFRFPYLADPQSMIAYTKSRNLAIFSIDIDSNDYKTKSAERVYSTIMGQLRSRGKGIMLFHDIQQSTANAMQRLLDTMQREKFKIVHVVAKAPVATLPVFDTQAQDLHDKRRTVATAKSIEGGAYETATGVVKRRKLVARPSKDRPNTPKVAANTTTPATRVQQFSPTSNPFSAPQSTGRSNQPVVDWRAKVFGN
jgi:peptidoglycan/xylan/chitin deacetylase (PgdA/CDA1 family)